MKKTTKAAIAGGLGVVLLAGGAGSLAFWTAEADGPEVDIQSGELSFGEVVDGTWTIQQNADDVDPAQPDSAPFLAGDKIVPGDVLTNTVSVPVTLEGKNIKAELDVESVVTAVDGIADTALAKALVVAVVPTNSVVTGTGTFTVPVTITVTFPWGLDGDFIGDFNDAKDGNVTFTSKYTLTQIPVTP